MSRADGVLVVVLKRKPFEDIRDGVKLEEYRGENWSTRLLAPAGIWAWGEGASGCALSPHFIPYHTLRAYLGYAKDRPMIERPIAHISWGLPNPAWTYGIVSGECFRIHLEPRF